MGVDTLVILEGTPVGYIMQEPVISRIHRIKGQVEAIEKMYEDEKYNCTDVITQIQAARGALANIAILILTDEARICADKGDLEELEKLVNKTFKAL